MTVLLTGATGFVGQRLRQCLQNDSSYVLRSAVRQTTFDTKDAEVVVGDINATTNWQMALTDCKVVIHTAARVHILNEVASDPLKEFRRVNVDGTLNLARQAASKGVQRFIFISSIKVNGEATTTNSFSADDSPAPEDAYAISKHEAEQGLQIIASETGMEIVIIRPPLVYGAGVKGNFQTMMNWLKRGWPLPLGAINNKRSFVALDNLIDLIITCINHPNAANQIFLVSDDDDLSTTELLKKMGQVLGKPARLLPFPARALRLAAAMTGKQDIAKRLCGSLQVDISKTKNMLNWQPPVSIEDTLKDVVI